jgi:transcriptional regulator with XRE-family HTH domain
MSNGVDWMAVGRAIREARRTRQPKMRQAELGEAVGVTQSAISRIEQGAPTTTTLLASICSVLGLDLGIEITPEGQSAERNDGPPEGPLVLAALVVLEPEERHVVRDFLEAIPRMNTDLRRGVFAQLRHYAETHPAELNDSPLQR